MNRVYPHKRKLQKSVKVPAFEPLETRQMFSVSLSGGVLNITTGSANDNINIDYVAEFNESTGSDFNAFISGAGSGPGVVSAYDIDTIKLNTGAGNDTVNISFCGANTEVIADLGSGNDKIALGDGSQNPTIINAGAGNDTVLTLDGEDTINAGAGNDYVDSAEGNDQIAPGGGLDTILGGDGDDIGANYNDIQLKADGSKIEAENFDEGGEGYAYHDTTAGNSWAEYRPDSDVDIAYFNNAGSDAVVNTDVDESLNYSVAVTSAGQYKLTGSVAHGAAGGKVHFVFFDGKHNVVATTASKTIPQGVHDDVFANVDFGTVNLPTGRLTMQLMIDAVGTDGSAGNFDFFRLTKQSTTGTITGTVFNDTNQSWSKDAGESGIGGVKVYLDANNNGAFDSGETSTTTNSSGQYTFSNVAVGTKHVRKVTPAGYRLVANSKNVYDVNVTAGSTSSNNNFALTTHPLINGLVFTDTNGNGKKDAGETAATGWTAYVDLNNNGKLDAGENTKSVDANGNFSFAGLAPGSYIVRLAAKSGYHQTSPANNLGYHVTVAAAQTVTLSPFGVKKN